MWQVGSELIKQYGSGELKDVSLQDGLHEAQLLNLDISKAQFKLGWIPRLQIEKAVEYTVEWYKRYRKEDVYNLCVEQISEFVQ